MDEGPASSATGSSSGKLESGDDWQWKDLHGWRVSGVLFSRLSQSKKLDLKQPKERDQATVRPIFGEDVEDPEGALEIRRLLYSEAMSAWRQLTDVRFRLMSMLPALSIVAFVPLLLLLRDHDWLPLLAGALLSSLGLALTHGLHIYEQRNDGLYDDLISRARRLEFEMGVRNGLMMGRVKGPNKYINHGRGRWWVFASVKAAWSVTVLALTFAFILSLGAKHRPEPTEVRILEARTTTTEAAG